MEETGEKALDEAFGFEEALGGFAIAVDEKADEEEDEAESAERRKESEEEGEKREEIIRVSESE